MAAGRRARWDEVPAPVRAAIEARLGSPVVDAASEPGGFSPGVAARCLLADGRRCFLKAVSPAQNPRSPAFHRREGEVAAALPPGLPVPRLLDRYDDGEWVALAFEEVDGHPPSAPWTLEALAATFAALDGIAAATTPCRIAGIEPVGEVLGDAFTGFRKLAGGGDGDPDRVDAALRARLDELADLEAGWEEAASGASLLHGDLRADNLLVRPDGSVVVVDWPFASVGAAWVDVLLLLPSVGLDGGPAPDAVVAALDPFAGVEAEAVDRVLVALTGFFVHGSTLPDPPGIPTLRRFQRAQGAVAAAWLLERLAGRRRPGGVSARRPPAPR